MNYYFIKIDKNNGTVKFRGLM